VRNLVPARQPRRTLPGVRWTRRLPRPTGGRQRV